ncbi:Microtubule-associated protein [Actinidia chinensis var. chinensis]|uniref:Microtubule-associated protein n=1 Tax=Actinidia chinensis var. chinensis TaxID=1590841 RepID=A0A2R6RSZ5_ACTCC|nr:Microtubule-associated protein [Actinidia chinensis var. chinensis]
MLLELEQECLDLYRRKVDQANRSRAHLRKAISDSEAELAPICSAMGERPVHIRQGDRLERVFDLLNTLDLLCLVLGIDFKQTVNEIHPSLGNDSKGTKNISNDTIDQLGTAANLSFEISQLQDLASSLLELWNLMDTPIEEQQMFQSIACNIADSEHEITEPNMLALDFINNVVVEVSWLEELKVSKMKELVQKKRSELEEICRKTHLIPESDSALENAIEAIECPAFLLEQIELQIAKVKEEAFSRNEVLEKYEKWLAACEEESWLEEYNMDENRYNAGRGMVEALASKITLWENERGIEFTYDGVKLVQNYSAYVPVQVRLLSTLEEYTNLQQEKEQERKRQRDQKKLQGQLMAEQEILFGLKPKFREAPDWKEGS